MRLNWDIVSGVYICAILADTKVQVGAGRSTGRTAIADDLTLRNILAIANNKVGHMHIDGTVTLIVINLVIVAATLTVPERVA